jgi:protein-S-isoprenylcysteine O-methyltransferase Ste14
VDASPGSPWLQRLCPLPSAGKATQSLDLSQQTSFTLFFGTLLCVIGAATKLCSQYALGYMYNSSLNLRPAHRLVSHGPYTYIRHPGYAGAIMSVLGLAITHKAEPSYFTACGIMRVGYSRAVWTWMIWSGTWCVSVIVRATKEDDVLSERFGVEYKHWKWKTSSRFVPWIF